MAGETAHRLQFLRADDPRSLGIQEAPHPRNSHQIQRARAWSDALRGIRVDQPECNAPNEFIGRQGLQPLAERSPDRRRQGHIAQHGVSRKGQRTWTARDLACRREDQRRLDVHQPIPEAHVSPGVAIVQFIRVEHHHVARGADVRRATVAKCLDARLRHANGICVMSMLAIGAALEPGFEQGDAWRGRSLPDPVSRTSRARSFKTNHARNRRIGDRNDAVIHPEISLP